MGIHLKNVEMKIRKKRPENRLKKFFKKIRKKHLHFSERCYIIHLVAERYRKKQSTKDNGLSPNGKATDSDSVISRFESL